MAIAVRRFLLLYSARLALQLMGFPPRSLMQEVGDLTARCRLYDTCALHRKYLLDSPMIHISFHNVKVTNNRKIAETSITNKRQSLPYMHMLPNISGVSCPWVEADEVCTNQTRAASLL